VRREVLYNILIESGVLMIKMNLSAKHNKVLILKHLSDNFPIQNVLRQGDALSPLLFNFALECGVNPDGNEIDWDTSVSGLC
jgi:hypothetical protein